MNENNIAVNDDSKGKLYIYGTRGYSAYEIAVRNGYVGTEEEWLESLVGPIGEQGVDGKSAYEVAVENGYIGTEEQWVNDFLSPDGYYNKDEIDAVESEQNEKINKKPYYFNTVAEMKAYNLKDGDCAITLGYYEVNDGGGSEYSISNDNLTADEGSIISLNNGLFAKLILDEYVNVNKFGLTNNKYMNDYWISIYNCALSTGRHILFPKGTYRVRKDDSSNNYIFTGKFISMKGLDAKILCEDSVDSSTDLFEFVGNANNHNQYIDGIEFTTQKNDYSNVRYFIKFVFEKSSDILYNLRITNNIFRKHSSYAIYTDGFANGGFNNCQFSHNVVYGLFLKSLSFGDSNKIVGNSLYGSEQIQLSDYVINLIQTGGSAGCTISENNCSSGLGQFEGFLDLSLSNNQIENTTQTGLDYLLKLVSCRDVKIDSSNFNAHSTGVKVLYSSGNDVYIGQCTIVGTNTLITSPNYPLFVNGVRGAYNESNFITILPKSSCSGLVTNFDICPDVGGEIYVDNNLQIHLFANIIKSYSIAPWKVKGNITAGDTFTNIDGAQIHFNAAYSLRFDALPKIPAVFDAKY